MMAARRSQWKRCLDALSVALLFYVLLLLLVLNIFKRLIEPCVRFLFSSRQPMVKRTPDSRFTFLRTQLNFDFKANYYSVGMGGNQRLARMHYLDEKSTSSSGLTLLLLHGEPTWCFLYRHMIPMFRDAGHRVIAPDFIGFGKSDKYTNASNCSFEMHCFALRHLIEHLDLKHVVLVAQDWGGIVGSVVASQMPDRFSAIVLMNTGLPAPLLRADPLDRRPTLERLRGGAPFLVWRLFVALVGQRLPVRFVFHKLMGLKALVADGYDAPFPDQSYKTGAAVWPLLVPLFPDDPLAPRMAEARAFLKMWSKPALLMSGDNDPITRDQAPILAKLMPDAERRVVRGAGHFLQETHPVEVAKNILHFINKAVLDQRLQERRQGEQRQEAQQGQEEDRQDEQRGEGEEHVEAQGREGQQHVEQQQAEDEEDGEQGEEHHNHDEHQEGQGEQGEDGGQEKESDNTFTTTIISDGDRSSLENALKQTNSDSQDVGR